MRLLSCVAKNLLSSSRRNISAWFVWKRLSAEKGLGFGGGGTFDVNGDALDTGGGKGAVNMGAGNEGCRGGVGRGGAGLN